MGAWTPTLMWSPKTPSRVAPGCDAAGALGTGLAWAAGRAVALTAARPGAAVPAAAAAGGAPSAAGAAPSAGAAVSVMPSTWVVSVGVVSGGRLRRSPTTAALTSIVAAAEIAATN